MGLLQDVFESKVSAGASTRWLPDSVEKKQRAGIIGATAEGIALGSEIRGNPQLGVDLLGFYDSLASSNLHSIENGQRLALGDDMAAIESARSGEIDLVFIALPLKEEERIRALLKGLSDTTATVHIVSDLFCDTTLHTRRSRLGNSHLLSLHDTPITGKMSRLKRIEDVVLSSLILLLVAPVMLLIACAVKATSRGPVLFKQRRYGLDGQVIPVWKFRTMRTTEDGTKVTQATRDDPRITRIGKFLRRSSLDELPQFLNVLQGHMSIVGPRPHAVAHNEEYRGQVPGYMLRHKVKPGITGWAQVNGFRGETDTLEKMEKRVAFDLDYIRHWSLWLDLKIILLTIAKGFFGKNVY